ncbi:hypothetical protein RR42_s0922 [Cupriavidus basilensis]|uniref:Uncharacterized protein n=1 Tax=Cupriavidus basilensis TaxID=68895 RepID=A0A0C4YAJ1_9BURK|nr:hypothetical protein RR42_s0922 [Cupriavidus basilensis]
MQNGAFLNVASLPDFDGFVVSPNDGARPDGDVFCEFRAANDSGLRCDERRVGNER